MSFTEAFMIIPNNPFASGLILFIILVAVMYFARTPAHLAIIAFSRVIHNAMRLSARAVMRAEARLNDRNREVLLAQGREAAERIIEREFDRVDATVRRDLAEYPALHRLLSEEGRLHGGLGHPRRDGGRVRRVLREDRRGREERPEAEVHVARAMT